MDDVFNCSQSPTSYLLTTKSASSASSAYDPFTPTSGRSTPHGFGNMIFDGPYKSVSYRADLTPPSSAMHEFMFGPVKPEPEHVSVCESLPSTPVKREQLDFEYEHMMDMKMANHGLTGLLTPSDSSGMYPYSLGASIDPVSLMMTPTQSVYGSEAGGTGSSGSCANDIQISFCPNRQLSSNFDSLGMDRHSKSPVDHHLRDPDSPDRMLAQTKLMVHGIQQKSAELQRAQIQSSRKRSVNPDSAQDGVREAMCKCDYDGCDKAFRRNEHLKRHKQTFHGEGPNRFSCEFCRKDQFNRQDNLNNHRKLHARPNSRSRGVKFIPTAVPVIEQEERSRKRRAPSKSKIAKRGSGD
ncbi:hypothetical protein FOYG_17376 [Fusarium oxysporum NRRL 32931]|uniref:C2H2-type domain-containing protein n=1 Tax=Fusarium oxysporum NRRL 32931 TaxID=660029 RepID=W9HH27_FUSOX|nr:hypothetical protein FOYG_17376 [Fusarium oxysporum NRRL 32931]